MTRNSATYTTRARGWNKRGLSRNCKSAHRSRYRKRVAKRVTRERCRDCRAVVKLRGALSRTRSRNRSRISSFPRRPRKPRAYARDHDSSSHDYTRFRRNARSIVYCKLPRRALYKPEGSYFPSNLRLPLRIPPGLRQDSWNRRKLEWDPLGINWMGELTSRKRGETFCQRIESSPWIPAKLIRTLYEKSWESTYRTLIWKLYNAWWTVVTVAGA